MAILDVDPDLAEGLSAEEQAAARRRLVAPTFELPVGPWDPGELRRRCAGALGLLVLDGLISRLTTLAGRTTGELLGAGDVLRPWVVEEGVPPVDFDVRWGVHEPVRLALLDRRFIASASRWPAVMGAVSQRVTRRSRSVTLQFALGQVPRVDGRLLLLFDRLGQRWGRVTPEGIAIPLRLTHETLAALVAARRPSVTSALGRLAEAGLLRRSGRGWLLDRSAEARVGEFLAGAEAQTGSRA